MSHPDDESVGEEHQDVQQLQQDAWATAEGYTPLAESSGGGGAIFMAYGPADDEDGEFPSQGGAFFADMTAFSAGPMESSDEEEEGGDPNDAMATPDEPDLLALADKALQSLDEEYSSTLQAGSGNVSTVEADNSKLPPSQSEPTPTSTSEEVLVDYDSFGQKPPPSTVPVESKIVLPKKQHPPIDTEAVRRAVDSIRFKDPRLTSNLETWQQQKKQQQQRNQDPTEDAPTSASPVPSTVLAPRKHSIIPSAPLAAFRKRTPKAIKATSNLSRSATLAEAVHRLSCCSNSKPKERLIIHIVGPDHVECATREVLQTTFSPFVRWIGALDAFSCPHEIQLHLVGPNVPSCATSWGCVDLLTRMKLKASSPLVSATATCYESTYHEWIASASQQADWHIPDLMMSFNSGIWGYEEWRPTLESLCRQSWSAPFISTAYTLLEAEDDADVVQDVLSSAHSVATEGSATIEERRLWGVELNPFGSHVSRATATAVEGREYCENAAWQAWKLGELK